MCSALLSLFYIDCVFWRFVAYVSKSKIEKEIFHITNQDENEEKPIAEWEAVKLQIAHRKY